MVPGGSAITGSEMHVMDTSPARLLLGRVTMGLWPPVEAEFGMGEREVYFGSARTRSSPEGTHLRAGVLRLSAGCVSKVLELSLHLQGGMG